MKKYLIFLLLALIFSKITYGQLWPKLSWYKTYNGPGDGVDIVQDVKFYKNNFYLAGRSAGVDSSQDLLILKYSCKGDSLLGIRFNAESHSWDEAASITIDSYENIYVVGSSTFDQNTFYALFQKYSAEGNLIFAKYFNSNVNINSEGAFITLDDNENSIIGYTQWYNGQSAIVIKYSSSGDSIWTVRFADDSNSYAANYLLTDQEENVYAVLTQSYWAGGDLNANDAIVAKISKEGKILWRSSIKRAIPHKILLDKEENVVLITSDDPRTVKFDHEGNVLWTDDNTNSQNPITVITGLVIDSDNNIVISGYKFGSYSWNYRTKKLSPNGDEVWVKDFDSMEGLNDFAMDLAIDSIDNLYVTGESHDQVSVGMSYTVTYSKDGDEGWIYKFDPPNSTFEEAFRLFIGDSNNVYIGGNNGEPGFGSDFLAFKIGYGLGLGISQHSNNISNGFYLSQNYPNPFNPTTMIKFSVPNTVFTNFVSATNISLKVFDVLGREVRTLVNEQKTSGQYVIQFDGSNLSSGIYYYVLHAGNFTDSKKMILIK